MTETTGFTDRGDPVADRLAEAPEGAAEQSADPGGAWLCIAFMGHNEYTGYVTEITKNGQPAYRVDLPEKLWGGNPLSYVEYAATAWFSDHPVTEEFVRSAWERHLREVAERKRREAEWQQRALTAGSDDDDHACGCGDTNCDGCDYNERNPF